MIKLCEFPENLDTVKDFDPAFTIIVLEESSQELINELNALGYYYIFMTENRDLTTVKAKIDTLIDRISKAPDQYYEIERFNHNYLTLVKNNEVTSAINALDKLLTSIKDLNKKDFMDIVKYSLDDIIVVKDYIKKLMDVAIEDSSYTLLYNNLVMANRELKREIASKDILQKTLEQQDMELKKVPELLEKLKNAEEENKVLFNKINSLEANRSTVDTTELDEARAQVSALNALVSELKIKNEEYLKEIQDKESKGSNAKDEVIEFLREELNKKNSATVVDIESSLPVLTPNKMPLPNTNKILYFKEVSELHYGFEFMNYLYLSYPPDKSPNVAVIIYDRLDNEFTKTRYESSMPLRENFFITNDVSLGYIKSIGISSFKYIIIVDRLGCKTDVIADYPFIEKYYTINNFSDIAMFNLDPARCVRSFTYEDDFDMDLKQPGFYNCSGIPRPSLGSKIIQAKIILYKKSPLSQHILNKHIVG